MDVSPSRAPAILTSRLLSNATQEGALLCANSDVPTERSQPFQSHSVKRLCLPIFLDTTLHSGGNEQSQCLHSGEQGGHSHKHTGYCGDPELSDMQGPEIIRPAWVKKFVSHLTMRGTHSQDYISELILTPHFPASSL